MKVVDPGSNVDWVWQTSKVSCDTSHQAMKRATSRLLPELTRSETEDVSVNHDAAHVLVASASARGRRAPVDQRVNPRHLTRGRDDRTFDRAESAATTLPHGKVVRVLQVSGEGKVTTMQY
jgi:hypothetical protein